MQSCENISQLVGDLKGDNRYIMDHLMEEVLRVQTDEIKEFLIKTSVLERHVCLSMQCIVKQR